MFKGQFMSPQCRALTLRFAIFSIAVCLRRCGVLGTLAQVSVVELQQEASAAQGDDSAMVAAYRRLKVRVVDMDTRHAAQEDEWNAVVSLPG